MKSKTISARVPESFADKIGALAASGGLTVSEYVGRVLRDRTVAHYPALAALAGVLQISAIVERDAKLDPALAEQLREHVITLSALAVRDLS